jgi:hypothetical protein
MRTFDEPHCRSCISANDRAMKQIARESRMKSMVKSTPKVRRHGSDKNSICKWALVALARGRSSDELEVTWAWEIGHREEVRAESSRDGARIRMGRGGHHRSLQRRGKGNDMVKGSNVWDPIHLSHHSIEVVGLTIELKKPSDGSHAWDPIHLSHLSIEVNRGRFDDGTD